MKVLFISSGNKKDGISAVVYNQGESLKNAGIEIEYYLITGKGFIGYLSHLIPLRKKIFSQNYDVLHAHYSYCGFLTALASPGSKIIVSLMGSFYKNTIKYFLIHFFTKFIWESVIVKSDKMRTQINLKNAYLIPNGVDLSRYSNLPPREIIRKELDFYPENKYIIFVSDPDRPEKNFKLANETVLSLKDENIKLIPVFNKTPELVSKFQIAADVLILTSFTEGSPNVIKEAMAACCPIVCTNVGDVEYVIGDADGCFVTDNNIENLSSALVKALKFGKRTNGIARIKKHGLDTNNISEKIIKLYNKND